MNRKKKLMINTVSSLSKQFISVVCGFILPRLYLTHYGSDVNGLVSSITQFLSLAAIFDSGMGVVIEASLFKPLADKDDKAISRVLTSGQNFYMRFVMLLGIYVFFLAAVYPFFITDQFDFFYTSTLVIAISISSFGQYCFGVTNSVLLSADQRTYINSCAYIVTIIANTILGSILITLDCPIHIVKLAASLTFVVRPVFLAIYVKKHYNVNWKEKYDVEPIKQKWNGFAQHIAALVVANTDIVVLTLLSSLKNVSIYSVYFLVVNGIKEVVNAASMGIRSLLGDMWAKKELDKLNNTFSSIEWIIHTFTTLVFTITAILIVPFVSIYTKGVTDVNYLVPGFAVTLCFAYLIYCLRLPYQALIMSAGHFKQTQTSSLIEAAINIAVSVVSVFNWGLIGVAVGTLVAMLYRTIYLAWYLKHNIIERSLKYFAKRFAVDCGSVFVMMISTSWISLHKLNMLWWLVMAIIVVVMCIVECTLINLLLCHKEMKGCIKMIMGRRKKAVQ